MGDGIEEDAIEATIRRVAAEKAARLAPDEGPAAEATKPDAAEAVERHPAAATEADATRAAEVARVETAIRRVATTKAARDAGDAVPSGAPAALETNAPEVDPAEAAIEATIRRVAEAKAAQRHGHGADAPASAPSAGALASAPPSGETPSSAPPAAGHSANGGWRPVERRALAERRAPTERRAMAAAAVDSGDGFSRQDRNLTEVVAGLRRDLDATRQSLAALAARVDAMTAVTSREQASPKPPATAPDEDGWDDAPTIPRIPLGQPPRPAIFRDPPQHAVAAERLVLDDAEVIIDTRPIPQPLPPLRAEARRGLDLLPRTYRVTVEDKRRGVDLVPLHRALLGMEGVRDMSLLSYSNGVAMVSLDTLDELDPDALCAAIARAMSRKATVEAHNETMVVKLAEE